MTDREGDSPADGVFEEMWEEAVLDYVKHTGKDVSQTSNGVKSLEDLKTAIEAGKYSFAASRAQGAAIRRRFDPIFRFLDQAIAIGGKVGEGAGFGPSKTIASAFGLLFESAKKVSTANDQIERLFRDIASIVTRFHIYQQEVIEPELRTVIVEALCQILRVLGIATKGTRRASNYMAKLMNKPDKVQEAVASLKELLEKEEKIVRTLTLRKIKAIDRKQSGDTTCTEVKAFRKRGLPPRPGLLLGRNDEVAALIRSVLAFESSVILGIGGIGKTSLSLTVLHHQQVQQHFSLHCFVQCEGITTLELMYAELADCLGISVPQHQTIRLREQIIDTLQGERAIICFDNFETLWDIPETRLAVEHALADFTNMADVSVIVTMRGSREPGVVLWAHPLLKALPPLTHNDALELFKRRSECKTVDEYAVLLVKAMDAIPLAVELLSYQARGNEESTAEVWERWLKKGTEVVSRAPEGRLLDLNASIKLSLNSPRLQRSPMAKSILVLLSLLPSGLDKTGEVYRLLEQEQEDIHDTLHDLISTAIAFIDSSGHRRRYRLLAPIARFAGDKMKNELPRRLQILLIQTYIRFLKDRSPYDPVQHDSVPPELVNSHNVLKYALDEELYHTKDFCKAVISLSGWMVFLGTPSDDLLSLILRQKDLTLDVRGDCLRQLGEVYLRLNQLDEAEAYLLLAIEQHQLAGSQLGEAVDRVRLGEVYLRQCRSNDAEKSLLRATELYDFTHDALSEGDDRMNLGQVYLRQGRLEEAEASILRAIELHQIAQAPLQEGNDRTRLGEVYIRLDRMDEAKKCLLRAIELHQQTHASLNEGTDRMRLGVVYYRQDQLDEAEASLLHAIELHHQAHSPLGEGSDRAHFAEVCLRQDRLDEAEASLVKAIELHQQAHDTLSEGTDRLRLGEVYLRRNQLDSAVLSLHRAIELHERTQDVFSLAEDRLLLGRVLLQQNFPAEAEVSLLQAVTLHRHAQSCLGEGNDKFWLGEVYLKSQQIDKAEASLLQAVELHHRARAVYYLALDKQTIGKMYSEMNRHEDAEKNLYEALRLFRASHSPETTVLSLLDELRRSALDCTSSA